MYKINSYLKLFTLLFVCSNNLLGSNVDLLRVQNIRISGNFYTKERVIIQELDIRVGDTVSITELPKQIEEGKSRMYNTGLFNHVEINYELIKQGACQLNITITENWYIYPSPIFELADRHFKDWWVNQNRALNRINYGLRAEHINFSGNRDKLTLALQDGYTRKYELKYFFPFLNKSHTLGGGFFMYYATNKEVAYLTRFNKIVFETSEDNVLRSRFKAGAYLKWRPNPVLTHSFRLEQHNNIVEPVITEELNPDYFLESRNRLNYFQLSYNMLLDKRQFRIYPQSGYSIHFNVTKQGIGIFNDINILYGYLELEKYVKPADRIILGTRFKIKGNITREKVPYPNNAAIGYGNNLIRGYELYVVDGTDYFYSRNMIKFNLFDQLFDFGKYMPVRQFRKMELKVYLAMNGDIGYVNDPHYSKDNPLDNSLIFGGGPAIDVIVFNNYLFSFEYNFNHNGEKGLFLHNNVSF